MHWHRERLVPIGIRSIGVASPANRQTQTKVADLMTAALQLNQAETRRLKSIYRATGIDTRHSVLEDFTILTQQSGASTKDRMKIYKAQALPLALQAIQNCLNADPNCQLNTISHIITISCTGMYAPGIDIEIIQALKLPGSVKRTAINFMGCYGVFNGLKMAESICSADPHAKVLLVSIELCSIHLQKSNTLDNLISAAIFADGAGALLIEANPSIEKYLAIKGAYCDLLPESETAMAWDIADQGFDIILTSYVAKLIESGIAEFFKKMQDKYAMDFESIAYYAIHPGSSKILQACEQALKLSPKDNYYAYEVLRKYGNMSSATIIFVLQLIWQAIDKNANHKNIFCCAFGPGLTLESMLLSVHYV